MSWEKVALSEIADFSNGVNFDKSAYSSGVKLIGVSNFGNRFSPDYDELQEIDANVVRPGDYLIDGDIVFVRSNGNKELVGRCMLIKEPQYAVTYSGFCIRARIKDTRKHNPTFFAYYFKSKAFRKALSGNAIGANIQNLSQGRLSNHIACVPDIEIQRKIAGILSAYDSLIENNQKQIKLLEEAAQRLYKEWFVDLRFPGYETTLITDGIPKGWCLATIGDNTSILRRGISPKYNENGPSVVINQKCIRQSVVNFGEARRQEKVFAAEMNLIDSDTVICSTGAGTLGRVGQIFGEHPNTTFDSHVTLVRASGNIGKQYLYHFLKSKQQYLQGMGKGSTNQLELSRGAIQDLPILVPPYVLCESFEQQAQPIHDKITSLSNQITLLCEARDALLPKLMNGEIEV